MEPDVGKANSEEKRKRTTLSIGDKIDIVNKIEQGIHKRVIMDEYNVGASTIYEIHKKKDSLLEFISATEATGYINGRKNMSKPKFDQLEKVLYEWFSSETSQGASISGPMIVAKAKYFKEQLNITEDFYFSNGWLANFKVRHGIKRPGNSSGLLVSTEVKKIEKCDVDPDQSILPMNSKLQTVLNTIDFNIDPISEEKGSEINSVSESMILDSLTSHLASSYNKADGLPENSPLVADDIYSARLEKLIADYNLSSHQIYSASESILYWKNLPFPSVIDSEIGLLNYQLQKEYMSFLTCSNASGEHKVKLLVIGNSENHSVFKDVAHVEVSYRQQQNSLLTKELFLEWFHTIFVPSVKENNRKLGRPQDSTCILLLDQSKPFFNHSNLVSSCGNIFVCFLPRNVSSSIQPLQHSINRSLKSNYRIALLRKLINSKQHFISFQKAFSFKKALYSIVLAWHTIPPSFLKQSWAKNSINDANQESYTLFDSDETNTKSNRQITHDFVSLLRIESKECAIKPQDIEEWLIFDEKVNYSQLFELQATNQQNLAFPTDPQGNLKQDENITWARAEKGLQDVLSFLEQNTNYGFQNVMQAHALYNLLLKKNQDSLLKDNICKIFQSSEND